MKMNRWLLVVAALASMIALAACTLPAPKQGDNSQGDEEGTAVAEATDGVTETPEGTETPELTETPEVTETPEATETAESTEEAGARAGCPGNSGSFPPPLGTLATAMSVDEATVQGYWCDGFGIGEIKKALTWAELTGVDAQTLFDMKKQGMGWGQIAKQLGIHPGKHQVKDHGKPDKGKPDKPGKPGKPGGSDDSDGY